MTNSELKIADAIREVTVAMQEAIADGYRLQMIDSDDLVDLTQSVAHHPRLEISARIRTE